MCKHSSRKTDVIEVDPAAAVTLDYDLINKIHPKLIGIQMVSLPLVHFVLLLSIRAGQ